MNGSFPGLKMENTSSFMWRFNVVVGSMASSLVESLERASYSIIIIQWYGGFGTYVFSAIGRHIRPVGIMRR